MKPVQHKHIVIRAEVQNFFKAHEGNRLDGWLTGLIDKLGMTLMMGPFSMYLDRPGLRGWTALVGIETSSITLHVWDECSPNLLQFDVYTCGDLDTTIVLEHLREFSPSQIVFEVFDREDGIVRIDGGIINGAI